MSDLRQQLQELVSEWRKRVVALFPDDLTRRAELERCVSQLDALVRAASPPAPPDGALLIVAERDRQKTVEGWTAAHDDKHEQGELLAAAARYLDAGAEFDYGGRLPDWPWEPSWFKPSADLTRNLAKAGALIAAEIDRQLRAAEGHTPPVPPVDTDVVRGRVDEAAGAQGRHRRLSKS